MRSFDVETAASLSGSYTPVGKTFSPGTRTGYITYSFGAKTSKYWGLNIKSNHGNRAYTSARFVQLLCCTACVVGQNVGPLIKTAKANTHHGKCSPLSTMLRHVHETSWTWLKRRGFRARAAPGAFRWVLYAPAWLVHHTTVRPGCSRRLLPQKTNTRAAGSSLDHEPTHDRAAILARWSSHCQAGIGLQGPIPYYKTFNCCCFL